jgi:hypothetical protein
MEVRLTCEASPDAVENEDHAVAVPGFVAVLDGVTVPVGMETGCIHGPGWFVRQLSARLVAAHADEPEAGLSDVLAAAIDGVRDRHGTTCDLDHPGTPQSTACLLRVNGDTAEYLVLCDSPFVYQSDGQVQVLTDLRLRATSKHLRKLALQNAGQHDPLRALVTSQRQHVNRPGGYWTAAATTEAAHHAITGTLPLQGPERLTRAALLTDGASRAVDTFALTDWPGLLDLLDAHGPAELIRRVRTAERTEPHRPRFKRHDDASAAYCRFLREDTP